MSVAVSPSSVTEDGATNLDYTFTRTGATTGALTVNFSVGGTAEFGTDYGRPARPRLRPPAGTVTFGAGNSTAVVTLDPTVDSYGGTERDRNPDGGLRRRLRRGHSSSRPPARSRTTTRRCP